MSGKVRERPMTVEEFLVWNLDQEERYEFVDGFPVPLRAMSGATGEHDVIVVNVIAELRQQLKGTPCRPRTADTALRTKIDRVRRPDVMVECAPLERGSLEARQPVAVFEVLSPTTRHVDRTAKLEEYKHHPTVRTIVLVDPAFMDVLVFNRDAEGRWDSERLRTPEAEVRLPELPVALPLAAIYDSVPLASG
jgi:Uma2 family endonuclease